MSTVNAHKKVGAYEFSTDKARLNLDVIHGYLSKSYWSPNIPREVVARAIEHSVCFGIYTSGTQVGFARVVTDYAVFMYLADVFILEDHRKQGLSVALMEMIVTLPEFQGLRTWTLMTRDAHELYRKFGFENHHEPTRFMIRKVPWPYPR
jgi:GNAT superfamily N-acetyltransferase